MKSNCTNKNDDFKIKYDYFLKKVNNALQGLIIQKNSLEGTVYKAMNYSLMAGGKRLRPILSLAVCEMLDADLDEIMPYALAIEMIHTYSLIHDDLPAMDNDDYRRGRLTNHKVFGEANAILAGDALLNYAYEYLLEHALKYCINKDNDATKCTKQKNQSTKYSLEANVKTISCIAKAAGANGMIGGQVVDIESEGIQVTQEQLEYMHMRKTGALIRASVMAPAILTELDDEMKRNLEKYSTNIGFAFQIRDDILDLEGDFELLGKDIKKDSDIGKSTFVTLYGLDNSREKLRQLIDDAIKNLKIFGDKANFLEKLAIYIAEREN